MHEASLASNLIEQILRIADTHNTGQISTVHIKLGALSHISPDHFKDHFRIASQGTLVENAELDIQIDSDITAPDAHEMILTSIEVDDSLS